MKDNYIREFDAKVVAVGDCYIVLNHTAFYPEGGGQSGDRGMISDDTTTLTIVNTKKDSGEIRHLVEEPVALSDGADVHGSLDWNWRYESMRFHTAQHVLSRYLQLNYEVITVGNMIKPDKSRADYSPLQSFDDEMKRKVEAGVNEILAKNLDVSIKFMPRKDAIDYLNEKGYQTRYLEMVPKSVKEFRVIAIGDYDVASCAGTHVNNTREIGAIKIGKTKNVGAGKRRIYFSLVN
jgi:misacylated tRNA(Ala) deacylase